MTGGFYLSKESKEDMSLKNAIEKIAVKELRSRSEIIRQLLWIAVGTYDKGNKIVPKSEFPATNPLA